MRTDEWVDSMTKLLDAMDFTSGAWLEPELRRAEVEERQRERGLRRKGQRKQEKRAKKDARQNRRRNRS